jgi:hypothetical protein
MGAFVGAAVMPRAGPGAGRVLGWGGSCRPYSCVGSNRGREGPRAMDEWVALTIAGG